MITNDPDAPISTTHEYSHSGPDEELCRLIAAAALSDIAAQQARRERMARSAQGIGRVDLLCDPANPTEELYAEVFSYPSVPASDVRIEGNKGNERVGKYGEVLYRLAQDRPDDLKDTAADIYMKCEDILEKLGIVPSVWTQDGTWVMWDIAKQQYYRKDDTAQDEQALHVKTSLDMKYYGYSEVDNILDDPERQKVIAWRQVGWDVIAHIGSDEACRRLIETVAATPGLRQEIVRKLTDCINNIVVSESEQDGSVAQVSVAGDAIRSSEYTEVGRVLAEL